MKNPDMERNKTKAKPISTYLIKINRNGEISHCPV